MGLQDDETQLINLPRTEQTLLWAIRTWVIGRRLGEDVGSRIDSVFRHIGVSDATPSLEGFLWVLSQGLVRTLQINCTCETTVASDETHLLEVFSLLIADRPDEAEILMRDIATERAALLAIECALRVALQFRYAGFGPDVQIDPGRRLIGNIAAFQPNPGTLMN